MYRILTLGLILMFCLAARGTGPNATEEIDRHYQAISMTDKELLQSESMILTALKQLGLSEPLTWRLARTYYRLGDNATNGTAENYFHSCIEQADRAIQLNNQSARGYFFRGICRGKLGEMQGVWKSLAIITPLKEDLLAAVKFDPSVNQGGPHRALGKLYLELPALLGGSVNKSVDHLKQAVSLGPEFADNYLFLAQALYENEDYPSAKNTLMELLKITKKTDNLPKVQNIRQQAHALMEKINPWLESQPSDAQRDQN
jgi:tetratricopeptide (TPR) repeat protein